MTAHPVLCVGSVALEQARAGRGPTPGLAGYSLLTQLACFFHRHDENTLTFGIHEVKCIRPPSLVLCMRRCRCAGATDAEEHREGESHSSHR